MKARVAVPLRTAHHLSDRIRQARELIGMNRADLARSIGVGPSAAVQWEHPNGTYPCMQHLIAIAKITDVSVEWLATGRGPPRLGSEHEAPAVRAECLAHDLFEEQMLAIARNVPMNLRQSLLHYLQNAYKPDKRRRRNQH
jgi:transcriptional regulator with XRE-family HTH domain